MRRHAIDVRDGWQKKVERIGLTYHTLDDGRPYWDESAYWEFSAAEIDRIESATAQLQEMALAAGDAILARSDNERGWLGRMGIPEAAEQVIRATWLSEPPALYGRMDLAYDGRQIKLLEYNADTPTALVEAAVAQWYWLEERFPKADQFNSLHEKLVAKWKDLKPYVSEPVYFSHDGADEDAMTVAYLADTAQQAGIETKALAMRQIGWDEDRGLFVDLRNRPVETVFKLYPWEWLLKDKFGAHALATMNADSQKPVAGKVQWIEPAWKMLWSNKALLAVLWELYPEHELLLPTYLDGPRKMQNYVRKPLLGREGGGISVFRNYAWQEGAAAAIDAGAEGFVYQQMASLAQVNGGAMVLGSWLIDGEPAGMGVRESDGMITTNISRFVPHLFR